AWGTHNGASRAFASVRANDVAEEKLAAWLGTEAVLIYPSVTLANMGAIPGLVSRRDLLVIDEHAHNSMQEGAKIAQANGVLGGQGRGTVRDALGGYDNTLVVGSLSKGFSCFGGFIGCPREFKMLLKIRSNTFIFGGPVPPPYLEAICTVCDIVDSPEYDQ